jgi:SHS2 domain-containing protein
MTIGRLSPSHEVVDHTSEVQLRLRAGSLGELLAEGGRALAAIQLGGTAGPATGSSREIEVSSPDRAALLADWLNELVFLAEAEQWVATEFAIELTDGRSVRARARGVEVERVPGLVKAATLHGLRLEDVPGGMEGEVILDV